MHEPPPRVLAVNNQPGLFGAASLGGLLLAWGGFPQGGLCCLGASVLTVVVVHLKVQDSAAWLAQMALRQGPTATEYGAAGALYGGPYQHLSRMRPVI
jgi:hypothetical protein